MIQKHVFNDIFQYSCSFSSTNTTYNNKVKKHTLGIASNKNLLFVYNSTIKVFLEISNCRQNISLGKKRFIKTNQKIKVTVFSIIAR